MTEQPPIDAAKPDWTNRRKVVFCGLRHMMALSWAIVAGALALAAFGKLDFWPGLFAILAFFTVAGLSAMIIGSYVFGASWEQRDFLNFLTSIRPEGKS